MSKDTIKQFLLSLQSKDENTAKTFALSDEFNIKDNPSSFSLLAFAATFGASPYIVNLLIKKGEDINFKTADNVNLLHLAVQGGNAELIQYFIDQGLDVKSQDINGNTFLHLNQNVTPEIENSIINILEKNDLSEVLKLKNIAGDSPILSAAKVAKSETLEAYLKAGSDLECRNLAGSNLLIEASGNRNVEGLKFALLHNMNVTYVNDLNQDALGAALWYDGLGDTTILDSLNVINNNLVVNNQTYNWPAYCHIAMNSILGAEPKNGTQNSQMNEIADLLLEAGIKTENLVNYFTPLERAAAIGDVNLVNNLIKHEVNVNSVGPCFTTAIVHAVTWNKPEVIKILLENGASYNFAINDENGNTVVHLLSQTDDIASLSAFTNYEKIQINIMNYYKQTPLMMASNIGLLKNVELILEAGGNPYFQDAEGNFPIHYASASGYIDVIGLLVSSKIIPRIPLIKTQYDDIPMIELRNGNLHTPIISAVLNSQPKSFEALLELGADPYVTYTNNMTIYHASAVQGDQDIFNLVNKRVNLQIDIKDDIGHTPLHLAAVYGKIDIVKALKANGADLYSLDNNGFNIVHHASQYGWLEIIDFALENNVSIDNKDANGATPLFYASVGGFLEVMEKLLVNKANINAIDYSGDSPLSSAIESGLAMIESFNNFKISDRNILLQKHYDAVKYLTASGADIDVVKSDGKNLLHIAAEKDHVAIFAFLHKNGIDCAAKTNDNLSAYDFAKQANNTEIMKYIDENCSLPGEITQEEL